jgi:hypothetical protein
MKPEPAPSRPRTGRGVKLALVLSLALNLLIVGALAGGAMRARMQPDAAPRADLRAMWMALPDQTRADLRAGFSTARGDRQTDGDRAARHARRIEQNARLAAALRAEEFDSTAFVDLLRTETRQRESRIEAMQAALGEALGNMDAVERAAVAARFEAATARQRAR